ncbi:MAG: pyridoxal phosphate-dependent aminotransferase [Sphingobacteriia bacterium]|nr:pyridoxal phosphate-dependent aminotransferase [Sphingobacteriia bacterium]
MSLIAERLKYIKPSPTLAVSKKANELKALGIDIISLSVGEPDFDTPDHIKEAAIEAIKRGETKYTNVDGTPELKKAIKEKFKNDNNLNYELNQIIVGAGGKQVLYNAIMASVNPGDEVIITSPYWVSYPDIVSLAQGIPVFINCTEENNFKLKAEDLAKFITPKTKWIILNSPSNPTGATYSYEELKAISEVLLNFPHVHILSDDIYEYMIYDNLKFHTIAEVEPKLFDRTLTLNGVSKSYSMTGWRIGYAGGPKELINAMSIIQSQSTSNSASISQAAALGALKGPQGFLSEWRNSFTKRRNLVVELLNASKYISCIKSEGAFYLFPNCKGMFEKITPAGNIIKNSNDVATYFLEEANVAVVPGIAFGMDGYFRISYATSEEILKEACNRINNACEKLK